MTTLTFADMRTKLIGLDEVRAKLAATESLGTQYFDLGDPIRFSAEPGLDHSLATNKAEDPVPVFVDFGITGSLSRRLQLTKGTLEEMCSAIGIRRDYVTSCPTELLIPHLNYWYREGLHAKRGKHNYQLLFNTELAAVAFGKAGQTPFSNLKLLDCAEKKIHEWYGSTSEVLVDYKLHHTLRQTTLRLIIPDACQVILPDDVWSLGLQLKNSLTGASQTSLEGYLFRWICTNGQIDTRASSGVFTRRKDSTEAEAYVWAREAVDEVLGGMEHALDAVKALNGVGINGSLSDTLRDIFEHYRIAIPIRQKVISILEEYEGEITMYVIMNAITQVANDPGLEASTVESLLRVGGDFPYTADQRCGACHRIMHSH